ncbi:MAG TPA: endonuclease/exonuclease/phosphatase family protein [Verrucomicrobiota bacterium]|nr:endonuclease/exonuclease/phosphatase family protein [Verrucomicrobiota bacterium]
MTFAAIKNPHPARVTVPLPVQFTSLFACILLSAFPANGQIPISAGTYAQSFDTLATSGTANAWADNATIAGWYASTGVTAVASVTAPGYRGGSGDGTAGALWSFGVSGVNPISDRALGALGSGSFKVIAFGVRFTNDTSLTITNPVVSFTGEMWRPPNGGTAVPNTLAFAYKVNSAPIISADAGNLTPGWTAFPALDFVSPFITTGSGFALDGNESTNRQVFDSVALTGVTVQPGEELFLRWRTIDDTGSDGGLAIDDLTVTFDGVETPEPPAPTTTNTLTVMQYNVKGNGVEDWSTNSAQVQAIGRQITYLNPDIIAFNEIPQTNVWQMANWAKDFLAGYNLATNSGTDGFIRSVIASRHPITRSTKWLDGVDLRIFGYTNDNQALDNFTRDLFEAQISVPGYPQPLHVFTTHLKATTSGEYPDSAAKRAAEAAAITNFLATNILSQFPLRPYLLAGDLNDNDTNTLAIQRLIAPATGLHLTNPRNPVTGSINTYSTTTANPSSRLDYIMPSTLLASNVRTGMVFRTDRLTPLPPNLNSNDCKIASDHLPVVMVFNNPYDKPIAFTSIQRSNTTVSLTWNSVLGQPYVLQSSTNLNSWTTLATNLIATGDTFVLNTNVIGDVRHFRLYRAP